MTVTRLHVWIATCLSSAALWMFAGFEWTGDTPFVAILLAHVLLVIAAQRRLTRLSEASLRRDALGLWSALVVGLVLTLSGGEVWLVVHQDPVDPSVGWNAAGPILVRGLLWGWGLLVVGGAGLGMVRLRQRWATAADQLWFANVAGWVAMSAGCALWLGISSELHIDTGVEMLDIMAVLGGIAALMWVGTYAGLVVGPWRQIGEGRCIRSGTFLGAHWFEFEGVAGRVWTRDSEVASTLRAHPAPLQSAQDWCFTLHQAGDPRRSEHLGMVWATTKTVAMSALIAAAGISAVLTVLGGAYYALVIVLLAAPLVVGIAILPATIATPIAVGWGFVSNRRRTREVVWTGALLRTECGGVAVDEPTTTIDLGYDPFGAVLRVSDGARTLTIRGDHAWVAALTVALRDRPKSKTEDRQRATQALQWRLALGSDSAAE